LIALRSGAPLIRDRSILGVCNDPGSAAQHSAALHAAPRPGNARHFTPQAKNRKPPTRRQAWRRSPTCKKGFNSRAGRRCRRPCA